MSSSSSSNSKITDLIKVSEHLCIPFQAINEATKNFTTLIGKGGYGLVYKGELLLSNKLTSVAVKRLDSNISGQGLKEFLTEIHLLSHHKHPNIVSLLGFCEEHGEKILVYDYAEHGSLEKYLTKGKSTVQLTWLQRINICIDAARGLDYLHNHVAQDQRIIHRDIKSANILLSHDWKAMIADFGLSLIGRANENVTFIITNASGTHGYCDPVYTSTGILTKESDVYSFGVVLFEVLCGRLGFINVNTEQRFLAPLAKRYYEKGRLSEIIDPYLKFEVDLDSLNRFSEIAYQCLLNDRERRPSIGLVLKKLEIETLFSGKVCKAIREAALGLTKRLAQTAKDTFGDFEEAVKRDATTTFAPGIVHPLTRYVISYVKFLFDYQSILKQLFQEFEKGVDSNAQLATVTMRILQALRTSLERKSKQYKNPALTNLFLMNNIQYMVRSMRRSEAKDLCNNMLNNSNRSRGKLWPKHDWVQRHRRIVQQHSNRYKRIAWTMVKDFQSSIRGASSKTI